MAQQWEMLLIDNWGVWIISTEKTIKLMKKDVLWTMELKPCASKMRDQFLMISYFLAGGWEPYGNVLDNPNTLSVTYSFRREFVPFAVEAKADMPAEGTGGPDAEVGV